MGLPAYSSSSDAGIACRILMSFAAAVMSIIKEVLVCVLEYAGISVSKWEDGSVDGGGASSSPETGAVISPSEFYVGAFKKRNRPFRGGKNGEECLVCLEELIDEGDGWVYKLVCGHVFHVACMETWLRHCNLSCPLCRANVVPLLEEEECIYPM